MKHSVFNCGFSSRQRFSVIFMIFYSHYNSLFELFDFYISSLLSHNIKNDSMLLCLINLPYTCIVFSQMCVFDVVYSITSITTSHSHHVRIKRRKTAFERRTDNTQTSRFQRSFVNYHVICLHIFESSTTIRFKIMASRRTAIEYLAI